jgi:hypothetical protein
MWLDFDVTRDEPLAPCTFDVRGSGYPLELPARIAFLID